MHSGNLTVSLSPSFPSVSNSYPWNLYCSKHLLDSSALKNCGQGDWENTADKCNILLQVPEYPIPFLFSHFPLDLPHTLPTKRLCGVTHPSVGNTCLAEFFPLVCIIEQTFRQAKYTSMDPGSTAERHQMLNLILVLLQHLVLLLYSIIMMKVTY